MKKVSLFLLLPLLFALCGHQAFGADTPSAPGELVPNGSFEEGKTGWSLYVPSDSQGKNCRFTISQDSPHTGTSCGLMQADSFARFWLSWPSIPVQPGERYRVSAWVRGGTDLQFQPRTAGVLIRLSLTQNKENSPGGPLFLALNGEVTRKDTPNTPAPIPTKWTQMEAVVEIPADADSMSPFFFCWNAMGSLYVDDVSIEKVDASVPLTPLTQVAQSAPSKQSAPATTNATPPLPNALIPEQPSWAKNHPRVIFDAAGLARVKQRIHDDPEISSLWNQLKAQCDAYVDPKSPSYLDASKAYDEYMALAGRGSGNQGELEQDARNWLTPMYMLGFAYAVSGDERYGRKSVELAVATAQKLTPDAMKAGFFYTRSFPTRCLALSLDWCYPLFTSDQRQIIRKSLIDFTNDLYYQNLNNVWGQSSLGRLWNWNGGLASACGLAALVLDGETHAPTRQWIFQSTCNVEDYLRFGIDAQGAPVEGPFYFGYGAGFLPYFVEAMRADKGEDLYLTTHYNRFADWLPMEILPGGKRINNIEDSSFSLGGLEAPLYTLDREPDRALARYIWEQLIRDEVSPPFLPAAILWAPEEVPAAEVSARVAKLPDWGWAGGRSIVVSRSGWGPDDVYMSLHAQHYTQLRHDHADKGEFTFYAYGDDLVISSGYGSISGDADNQVMVDGHPELMGSTVGQTDGWIVNSLHEPLVDLTCADVADAYRFFYKFDTTYQKMYQQDFQRADRHALFIREPFPYAVIFDDVKKDGNAHDYTWLLHAKYGKTFERVGNAIQVVPSQATSETAVVRPFTNKEAWSDTGPAQAAKWQATLQVPTAGKYQVWGLTGTADPESQKSNSFFLQINHGKMGFSGGPIADHFTWGTYTQLPLMWVPLNDNKGAVHVPPLEFPAGPVQLELSARQSGADCAALALVPDGAPAPVEGSPLPAGTLVVRGSEGDISGAMVREPVLPPAQSAWLQVDFLTPEQWEEKTDVFQTVREGMHPRLLVTMHGTDGQFLTLLLPHRLKDNKPDGALNVQSLTAQKGHAGLLPITTDTSDLVACWDGSSGIAVQDIDTDAELLWLRRDAAGKIVGVAASNVSRLTVGGHQVFSSSGGKTCFVLDGDHAQVPEEAEVKFDLPDKTVEVEKVKRSTDWFSSRPANENE
ncbi:MAG: heparinase II/III family protein [Methylacidiphilales bacterium]|nr:heparinase II/III family protein [Candidatus Methylacidiphilales bacterium]